MERHYEEPSWSACLSEPLILEVIKEGTVIDTLKLIGKPYFLIGRTPECDIQLDHPSVSRLHAVIQSDGAQVYLYDLQSTHGTFLNKTRVDSKQYYLFHVGELLRFGLSSRQFVLAHGTKEVEEEEEKLLRVERDSSISFEGSYVQKDLQTTNDESSSNWVYEEEFDDQVFETKDEEKQRLEALGGFEDVLGANYSDGSDDEFYDRTASRSGETLVQPTVGSHCQQSLFHSKHKKIGNENFDNEEEDELERFMKQNDKTLQTQFMHSIMSSSHSDGVNPVESISSETIRSSSIDSGKEENKVESQEKEKNWKKRARISYGPTRASLPVYDEKLISAQMSDPDRDWQPPSGQSGDGKTWLNDVLNY
ncbi:hypothetical protein GpartN1_g7124.t1 [Galdieria partita]|uniref:FHA domain-containing protein n=1 Tax=Galdieria partita TaxID=83374 RepID=A0A9C7Q2M0_9RHOD|nr:hypothetical protein GpartN1_g6850.t1 [Galdieria partita]GJQ15333.1 hypothetical protein GpartN1_g7124.t1 [Galdieria partita]